MKRKKKKVARPDPFAGITRLDCCDGCTAAKCAISRRPYCAHPNKGGLQSADCRDPAAAGRLQRSGALLADQVRAKDGALLG